MPQDPSDKPPSKRALTHGGPGRHARHSPTAGAPIAYVEDEVTGQYEGAELDQKRHERDARMRERLAVVETQAAGIDALRRDLRTIDTLVAGHNVTIEITVKPLIERLQPQLEAIRIAQAALDAAIESAITDTASAIADMTRQLQEHGTRIAGVESDAADALKRMAVAERTIATHTTELAALASGRTVDVKVGSWVRRNLTSIVVTALSTIAGLVGGYLATKLGVTP